MNSNETFRKTIFGGGAASSDGYKVFFNSKTSIEYVEAETRIFLGAELLVEKKTMAIFPEEVHLETPDGNLANDGALRERVLQRIKRAAAFLGWTLE
jgi:hypothetical protein